MSILKRKRNIVLAGLAAVGLLAAGTVAYAAFSTTTHANASGTAASLSNLNVNSTSVVYHGTESGLWPNFDVNGNVPANPVNGNHLAQVKVNVTNPNETAVQVTGAGISGTANFSNNSIQAVCDPHLGWTSSIALEGGAVNIAAGGTATLTLDYVYLDTNAPNDCAGKNFSVHLDIPVQAI